MGTSDVGLTQPPTQVRSLRCTFPTSSSFVTPQPPPTPNILPIFVPRWVKVPQRLYDHGRRQWDFERLEPVFFSVNGIPGINLGHALRKQFTGLDGRDDPVLQGTTGVISCRLMVWSFTLSTSDQS